ncbi:uncharacterized protein N7500_000307 [Penicillium coprophilum]|uniref:uncharacterized protein n=1 Tax=Penicillium coprophilum TaxID=36646 RepID=UPI002385EDC1|nr:uncharacterized protein N7500_000307 [Penicillium coprophilum]KAJ5177608.1 hypothetical protein N7500_000307 [Penicillium coprophilum]
MESFNFSNTPASTSTEPPTAHPKAFPKSTKPPRPRRKVGLDTPIAQFVSRRGDYGEEHGEDHGEEHKDFPKTIREYYELDSATLNDLSAWFYQFRPETEETRDYPTVIANPWLTWNCERRMWIETPTDVEIKRCEFGKFIGLSGNLVDPRINPLKYNPAFDKSGKPTPPTEHSGKTPSGAVASDAGTMQRRDRQDKRKGFFARLGCGRW